MSFPNRKVIISKMEKSADREKGMGGNQMVRTETKGRGQEDRMKVCRDICDPTREKVS